MTTNTETHPEDQALSIAIPEVIRLLTERYGPFPQEPRLDPAHELVFTILSQHTSDVNSERAFRRLMEHLGSLDAVAEADVALIEEAISVGGLARVKAPRIKEILNRVLELNEGSLDLSFLAEMPLDEAKAWLRQLPGIGPKSAGIILSFSLGMPAMAVDVHIFRVARRLGLIGPKVNTEKAHDLLEEAVEPLQRFPFHVAFITHGRQTCKAQRPLCHECVVSFGCPSRGQFLEELEEPPKNRSRKRARSNGKHPEPAAPLPHTYPAEEEQE